MIANEVTRKDLVLGLNPATGTVHWLWEHTAKTSRFSRGLVTLCSFVQPKNPRVGESIGDEPTCKACIRRAADLDA